VPLPLGGAGCAAADPSSVAGDWRRTGPAPHPFNESVYHHDYPGWEAAPPSGLGIPRTLPRNVPFLGKTTYAVSYTGTQAAREAPPPDTHLPLPTGVPFDGRTIARTSWVPHAHLPGTEFVAPVEAAPAPAPSRVPAPFDATSSYTAHYPPHPGARPPASFKRPEAALPSIPFTATSTHRALHDEKALPEDGRVRIAGSFAALAETRDWTTQHGTDFVPKPLSPGVLCPASRLPRPPSPSAAPQAWERDGAGTDHVLWDTAARRWAL
jgi:hypothetical protein